MTLLEATRPTRARRRVGRRVLCRPAGLAGLLLVAGFVAVATLGPLLVAHDPTVGDLSRIRPGFVPGPSAEHPLGLDHEGRDELSRIVYGARYSLVIGVGSMLLGGVIGLGVGAAAAACGGWVDAVLMRMMDVLLSIPSLLLAIALAAVLGPGIPSVVIAIGVTAVPPVTRLLRSAMVVERERNYVEAARAVGVTQPKIVLRHVLPNSLGPVTVGLTLGVGTAILEAAGLSFLGLGVSDPSIPEWGRMLADTQRSLQTAPQLALFPGSAIVLAALGFNLLGDALREAFDPRLGRDQS